MMMKHLQQLLTTLFLVLVVFPSPGVVVVAWTTATTLFTQHHYRTTRLALSSASNDIDEQDSSVDISDSKRDPKTGLPELKGDFDWDEKFKGDSDWITENVPGKVVLNEIELAAQATALGKLEETWRRQREVEEYEASKKVGFVGQAEMLNGRVAMFFVTVGLLTEYWTGFSFPAQVEELARNLGLIGFE